MRKVSEIIEKAQERRASDVHIGQGLPVQLRVDGALVPMDDKVISNEECEALVRELAGTAFPDVARVGEVDTARTYSGIRCRINAYIKQGSYAAAIRLLNSTIPAFESLGLPGIVASFATYQRGIVLVTGETGSGKSTTLASLIDMINTTRADHIITLEDPIEYIHTPKKCVISQREIGRDTKSFASGLRASLREDPDVILVGEMRDLETIEIALTAAETGHLVFGTLHTNSAPDSIDRIVDVFPAERQQQIRMQLSMTLKAVVSQQLLRRRDGNGRVAICEVMLVTNAIKNLIREGKTPQIKNSMATSAAEGNITMDNALVAAVRAGQISRDMAMEACHDPEYTGRLIGMAR